MTVTQLGSALTRFREFSAESFACAQEQDTGNYIANVLHARISFVALRSRYRIGLGTVHRELVLLDEATPS